MNPRDLTPCYGTLRVLDCARSPQVPAQYPQCGYWYPHCPRKAPATIGKRNEWFLFCGYWKPFAGTGIRRLLASTRNFDLSSLQVNGTLRVLAGTCGYWNRLFTHEALKSGAMHIEPGERLLVPASTRKPPQGSPQVTQRSRGSAS